MTLELYRSLIRSSDTKIVLMVMDGLGGLPSSDKGKQTELEAAHTPHLDELAAASVCGLHQSVGAGITPGSGPGHLSLFGYDPTEFQVGRGVLAALGIDFDLEPGDVAARGNFCTVDKQGLVTDRRAGRISSSKNRELCTSLSDIEIADAELIVDVSIEPQGFKEIALGNLDPSQICPLKMAVADKESSFTLHYPVDAVVVECEQGEGPVGGNENDCRRQSPGQRSLPLMARPKSEPRMKRSIIYRKRCSCPGAGSWRFER